MNKATSSSTAGSCTLVGAGPGDPELLTLKAVKAIQAATVLLVDDLVSDSILASYARPDARIVHVGKRGGCKSTPQAFIERLMITAVREGETVVRLKGGDPFIFGRGGEEVEHLREAGIECTVVNGITAGLAAVTSLGVPLTHRDHAQGVVFVTGHAKTGAGAAEDPTDWRALAATAHSARLTLVIYMGVAGAGHIERELLHGLPGDTPVAVVQHASLPHQRHMPHQRHVATTLGKLQAGIAEAGIASPAVIVVGDVLRGLAAAALPADANRFGT
ncbi:MAG: uroporphyrinogen-III C-methyltransferase [Variovorax paradoxus]|nr:uroporphyrinogen-III C-methyltransferase [Variovorax paradoxus]MBW8718948.1 uroporphyrinogen-III C-methyltransferase [Variovorax paradoxus]